MARRTSQRPQLISTPALKRTGVSLLLIALIFLAAGLGVNFVRMAWQEHQINREMEQQAAENAWQAAENQRLKGQADFAESNVAVELAARERLGMARDGETVMLPTVVLPAAAPPIAEQPAPADQTLPVGTAPEGSNAARWFKALFPGPNAVP